MASIDYKKLLFIFIATAISLAIAFICTKISPIVGLGFAIIPFLFLSLILILNNPFYGVVLSFIYNYFAIGLTRYVSGIQPGIIFDATLIILIFSLLVNSVYKKIDWKSGVNFASIVSLIWVLYCLFELFNPVTISDKAWFVTVRGVALYFFLIIFLITVTCKKYSDFKSIILILGVLTLAGTAKALMQKYIGFDEFEKIWLYRDGGYTTHIISSGIRYFSFFSDASIFGAVMGMAMTVFLFLGIIEKKRWIKLFFFLVSLCGLYSLILSGTRAAFVIPFAGCLVYIFLSKKYSAKIISLFALIIIFSFFRFTNYGNGNQYIRRIRTTFHPTEDASFQVRLANQKKLKEYMADKPFGAGIGHGGVKAKKLTDNSDLSQIPTDSWFVMIWVETGVVGLVLNIAIWLSILAYCSYIIFYKLKNPIIRGEMVAILGGTVGILIASYANEILGQMPVGVITYSFVGFIILSPEYERELTS